MAGGCFCKVMKFYKVSLTFFLTDWRHMSRKNYAIEISSIYWNVLLWILLNFLSRPGGLMRWHGKISSWQSGIPALQKRDPVVPGWNVTHVIAECNLWRVYKVVITRSQLAGMKFCLALPEFRQCYKLFKSYILQLHVKRFIPAKRDSCFIQPWPRFA